MASSGSFTTSKYSDRGLKFSWSIKSQDIAKNQTTISWSLKGTGGATNTWYMAGNFKVVIAGSTVYSSSTRIKLYNGTTVASGTKTITHNTDGTKSFSASAQAGIYYTAVNCSGSGSWSLTAIPRYATVSQTLTSRTETTAVIKWTSDSTIDYIWYSKNNGSSWTGINVTDGKTGSYTLTGLTANTTYQVKTRVRRKDSQLNTDSSALSVTTYAYPNANSMPNFTIGGNLTIGVANPMSRSCTVEVLANDNTVVASGTTSGTTCAVTFTQTGADDLYSTIPNAKSGTYKVRVTYGSQVSTKNGGTYTVNTAECSPIATSCLYADINSTTTAITGDDQDIIQGYSTVRYYANGLQARKYATIAGVSVAVNGQSYNLTISNDNASGGDASINSGTNVTAVFTVTDSRGVTAKYNVEINMLGYSAPTGIVSLTRENNFYTESDLLVDANYADINGGNHITITYKARVNGTSAWTVTGTAQDNVVAVVNLDNTYAWEMEITLTDTIGGTATYSAYVAIGMPIIYFDRLKSSVGINCFPEQSHSLENNGYDLNYETATCTVTQQWENYVSGQDPIVRRQGRVVYLNWQCKPTEAITLDLNGSVCCTIPVGFRPTESITILQQGSNTDIFRILITDDGNVAISRLRGADGSYKTTGTWNWFPIMATWII